MTVPPQYPPQPPYSGPPQPNYPQPGFIDLTVQGSVMTSNMITPDVWLNGYKIPTSYGLQQVPIQPGPVHVEASAQWMRRYGQASMDVTVAPGQHVPVFYAAPLHQFTTGSMGSEKQRRKGMGVFIAMMAVLALIFIGAVAVIAFL